MAFIEIDNKIVNLDNIIEISFSEIGYLDNYYCCIYFKTINGMSTYNIEGKSNKEVEEKIKNIMNNIKKITKAIKING